MKLSCLAHMKAPFFHKVAAAGASQERRRPGKRAFRFRAFFHANSGFMRLYQYLDLLFPLSCPRHYDLVFWKISRPRFFPLKGSERRNSHPQEE
jgi:hypothetical protein